MPFCLVFDAFLCLFDHFQAADCSKSANIFSKAFYLASKILLLQEDKSNIQFFKHKQIVKKFPFFGVSLIDLIWDCLYNLVCVPLVHPCYDHPKIFFHSFIVYSYNQWQAKLKLQVQFFRYISLRDCS